MKTLFFVSSNKNKLLEYQKLLRPFTIKSLDFPLNELQTEDLKSLCEYKLTEAMKKTNPQSQSDLFIEDSALYFEDWTNFPGPFIKWMLQSLRPEGIYKSLHLFKKTACAECGIAFYDSLAQKKHFFKGRVQGTIVAPRGKNHFGWDSIFLPQGHQKTFAEMDKEEKNSISHRYLAAQEFLFFLEKRLG